MTRHTGFFGTITDSQGTRELSEAEREFYKGVAEDPGPRIADVKAFTDAALNGDLDEVKRIFEKSSPKQQRLLLSTEAFAAIPHLRIARIGTPLQMALYRNNVEMVGFFKEHMDPEEFRLQSSTSSREALMYGRSLYPENGDHTQCDQPSEYDCKLTAGQ